MLGRDRMESDPAQPGARGLSSPRPPGHREIHVIDTDYEQDAILRVSLHWQGQDFHVLKYFSKRTPRWGLASLPRPGDGPAQPPGVPTARSLEDEYGPGFWRFRELTADVELYLVARHGESQAFRAGVELGTPRVGSGGQSHSTSRSPVPQGGVPSS